MPTFRAASPSFPIPVPRACHLAFPRFFGLSGLHALFLPGISVNSTFRSCRGPRFLRLGGLSGHFPPRLPAADHVGEAAPSRRRKWLREPSKKNVGRANIARRFGLDEILFRAVAPGFAILPHGSPPSIAFCPDGRGKGGFRGAGRLAFRKDASAGGAGSGKGYFRLRAPPRRNLGRMALPPKKKGRPPSPEGLPLSPGGQPGVRSR